MEDAALAPECGERVVAVEQLHRLAVVGESPAARPLDADDADQYVARPPEMSKQAPVEKVMSSLASQQMSEATSSGCPTRASGMRAVMYEMCSSEIWPRIGVSI